MLNTLLILVFCHLIGDYVLQSDFLAKTKGENWYHLFIHCALYCIPFYVLFGLTWQLLFIFAIHLIVDPLKARYNKISYAQDQLIHYLAMMVYLI